MSIHSKSHLRPTPSISTPSPPSTLLLSILDLLRYPYILLVGIPSLAYTSISYLLTPRPFPTWTLQAALDIKWRKISGGPASYFLPAPQTVEEEWSIPISQHNTTTAAERENIDVKVVEVEPVPEKLQQKGISFRRGTKSVVRPGFWLTPDGIRGKGDEMAKDGEKVILHIHGGGYVRGHPLWIDAPHGFAITMGQRLFSINYRKCLSDDTAFPAPLLDALAGYIYLTQTLNFPSSSITLIGESAGAHLCLILSRHLSDLSLSQPGAILLISPWADFTINPSNPGGTYETYEKYDFLTAPGLNRAMRSATRFYTSEAIRSAYFSPALAEAGEWEYLRKEGVRVLVAYGTKEVFEDEDKSLIEGMKIDGVDVQAYIDLDGYHARVSIQNEAGIAFRTALGEWVR